MLEEREDPGGTVRITFSPGLIANHFRPFERDKDTAHYSSSTGKNALTFSSVSTISITIGKSMDKRRIFAVCRWLDFSKTHRPAQHRCASQLQFARFQNNRLVQRSMLVTITFADKIRNRTASSGRCITRFISATLREQECVQAILQ